MPVQDLHKDYLANIDRWKKTRAAVKGKDAILDLGKDVLPLRQADTQDPDEVNSNEERYSDYSIRAHYYNATGRTKRGLLGLLSSKPEKLDLPDPLRYLEKDSNGAGVGLLQQVIKSVSDVLDTGRGGLFPTFPQIEGNIKQSQKENDGLYARIVRVLPENIINWKTKKAGSEIKLSLVVIKESYEDPIDEYSSKCLTQFRVLKLVEGVFKVEVHKKDSDNKALPIESYVPTSGGKPFDRVLFQFLGSENNDHEIDEAPLNDLAETNLAHFRNSADFEEAAHLAKELTLVLTGLTQDWYDENFKDGIKVGTMSSLPMPVGGDAKMLQPAETMMAERGMSQKEAHMVALGAQIVDRGNQAKTATQVIHEASAEHSTLSMIAENASRAYENVLNWVAQMEGVTGKIAFELPKDYITDELDAQNLTALVSAWQQGAITNEAKNNKLRSAGIERHDKTDEEIAQEIEDSVSFINDD